jgi:hypothetical protein
MHQDSLMTYRTIVRQNRISLTKDDSWVLTNLLTLPFTYSHKRDSLANEIFKILSAHPSLANITRACVVRRLGESNRLVVMSSENANGIENTMPVGYSCFVNGQGSLFQLQPGTVRFFADANRLVENFKAQHLPPQRSIVRISKANHSGGLCSGIYDMGRLVGFLFLNGPFTQADLNQDEMSILLYQANAVVTRIMSEQRLCQTYYELSKVSSSDYLGMRLDVAKIQKISEELSAFVGSGPIAFTCSPSALSHRYLVSHGNIAQIIARASAIAFQAGSATINISEIEKYLRFDVISSPHQGAKLSSSQQMRLREIASDCDCLNMNFECRTNSGFRLDVLMDQASSEESVNYSVELD